MPRAIHTMLGECSCRPSECRGDVKVLPDNAAMTSFEEFEDILNNRSDSQSIPANLSNTTGGRSVPREPINLGSDPGALLATLPALLGFVPAQSVVVIGLVPAGAGVPSRMSVGPVVRVDFHQEAVREGVETFVAAIGSGGDVQLNQCEAILIGIGSPSKKRSRALAQARAILEEHYLTINGHFVAHTLSTGSRWQEVNTGAEGKIGDIDDNPVNDIATLAGARRMRDREEMEHWLDEIDDEILLTAGRCVKGCSDESRANCAGRGHGTCVDSAADVIDIIEFYKAVQDIATGEITIEQACESTSLLTQTAYLALNEVLHPTLIVAGAGAHAPIVRDILATAARHTRGTVRWRLMALLAVVAGGNDEGTLAFATLMRTMHELETVGEENSVTAALTLSAISAHQQGRSRELLQLALERGLQVLAACHDDLHLAADLGARLGNLLEDFDACLDILDIDYLRHAGVLGMRDAA